MQRKTGTYEITAVAGERVRAFIPAPLPPQRPVLQNEKFTQPLAATQEAIDRLNTVSALTVRARHNVLRTHVYYIH